MIDVIEEISGAKWAIIFVICGTLAIIVSCLIFLFAVLRVPKKNRQVSFFKLITKNYIREPFNEKYKRDLYFIRKTFILVEIVVSLYVLIGFVIAYNFAITHGVSIELQHYLALTVFILTYLAIFIKTFKN